MKNTESREQFIETTEQQSLDTNFLQEQVRLPESEWDQKFRDLVEEKSKQNQEEIRKTEEELARETQQVAPIQTEDPEVMRERQFADYIQKLELSEGTLRGKKVLDLGCGDGKFVEYLLEKGITDKAYGVDMQLDETSVDDKFKPHFIRGNFEEDLPLENADYMVSLGAVSAIGSAKNKEAVLEKWLENLQEGGEIRIYPITEPAKDNPYESLQDNWAAWNEVLKKLEAKGAEYHLEPKSIRVMGKDNEVVLDYLLTFKKT